MATPGLSASHVLDDDFSAASSSATTLDDLPPRRHVSKGKKAIAAVTGAVATSLTMTPFDVIKTRLQMQANPEPLFAPNARIGPPSFPLEAPGAAMKRQGALRAASAHPATCCHATYFTSNADAAALACVHDPRLTIGPKGVIMPASPLGNARRTAAQAQTRTRAAISTTGSAIVPRRLVAHKNGAYAPTPPSASTAACVFPDREMAARELERGAGDKRLRGLWDGVVKVGRAEGVKGLWRGLSPTLMMTVPSQVTYMTCYDSFRTLFLSWEVSPPPPPSPGQGGSLSAVTAHSLLASLAAGALSRSISATLVTPLELVRTRLQATVSSSSGSSLRALLASLRGEVRAQGPLVLWRGLAPTLWRDVPFSAIYFMGYEGLKRILTGGGLGEGAAQGGAREFAVAFVAGATSGTAAAVVTHPFDLLKTRQQAVSSSSTSAAPSRNAGANARLSATLRSSTKNASGSGTLAAMREIMARQGVPGLFTGLTPRIAKVAPACGIMIASFEVVGRALADAEL